ncbi:type IV toxin-antitoxin system AbiEi family antitoxin domain-containing protein [Microbacterium oxydans]|uniref:type IV toxin-antitoxin system AbiEi family antitoxin domain-containing protein n=1 Tax=Microbacterium oxydans TaxID=82380 RepID=UPI003B9767C1
MARTSELRRRGVSRDELSRTVHSGEVLRPRQGVYALPRHCGGLDPCRVSRRNGRMCPSGSGARALGARASFHESHLDGSCRDSTIAVRRQRAALG